MDIKSNWIRAGQIAAQNERQSKQVFDALHEALDFVGHYRTIEKKDGSLLCSSIEHDVAIDLNAPAGAVTIRCNNSEPVTVGFGSADYDAVPRILVAIKGADKDFAHTFDRVIAQIEKERPAYVLT